MTTIYIVQLEFQDKIWLTVIRFKSDEIFTSLRMINDFFILEQGHEWQRRREPKLPSYSYVPPNKLKEDKAGGLDETWINYAAAFLFRIVSNPAIPSTPAMAIRPLKQLNQS